MRFSKTQLAILVASCTGLIIGLAGLTAGMMWQLQCWAGTMPCCIPVGFLTCP